MLENKWINRILLGVVLLALGGLVFAFIIQVKARTDGKESVFKFKNNNLLQIRANFNEDWADTSFWDDGMAEVNQYQATRKVYDSLRNFNMTYIVVKEEFNAAYNVKTNSYNRDDVFQVLKLNAFCSIPTNNYPYHYASNAFILRKDPLSLHKLTASSQEWCGSTFKSIVTENGKYQMDYNSYWDEQGKGKKDVGANMLFEDQLIYTLRALNFRAGMTFKSRIYETVLNTKVSDQDVVRANFSVSEDSCLWNESMIPVWKVEVQFPNYTSVYSFEKTFPFKCIMYTCTDGRSLSLLTSSRYAYWN